MIQADEIKRAAMIGAGTMGAGMGICFARAGYDVILYDIQQEQLDLALRRIDNSLAVLLREGIITAEKAKEAKARVDTTLDLAEALNGTQFVLEAAPERLDLKHRLFRELDGLCAPEVILASNTSGLSVSEIAESCRHPERVAGMHWVNPPELVPLVEVIRGAKTAEQTLETIYAVALKLGKVPVMIRKEAPGFGLNRLQFAVLREALHMVEHGMVSAEDVDKIMRCGLGFRYSWLGPLETADLGGLDTFHSVASYLFKDLNRDAAPSEWFSGLVEKGRLGIKSGAGFYDYEAGAREEILRKRDTYFVRQWKLIQEVIGSGKQDG